MGEVWGSTINHPTSESASIVSNKGRNGRQSMFFSANYPFRPTYTSNKRVCGVNQKVAPGLSATQNMILRSRHSGVKSVMLLDCCGYYIACTIGSPSKCPSHCKTYNFNINCSR